MGKKRKTMSHDKGLGDEIADFALKQEGNYKAVDGRYGKKSHKKTRRNGDTLEESRRGNVSAPPQPKEDFLDEKLSRKVLVTAQEQTKAEPSVWNTGPSAAASFYASKREPLVSQQESSTSALALLDFDDDDEEEDAVLQPKDMAQEDLHLSEADEKLLSMFSNHGGDSKDEEDELAEDDENMDRPAKRGLPSIDLADLILRKIDEHKDKGDMADDVESQLDPKVIAVYRGVGSYLSHYTAGKIPKAFKVVPTLKKWEQILYFTSPQSWSPQAVYAATKLFSANLNPKMAQRFYYIILLPRIQDDIAKHKTLNYHLYQSVMRSLYKPSAFFKGILLPMAEWGCSPREAVIMASVLTKASIPAQYSALALVKLCELEFSNATMVFIKALISKKFALPNKAIDAIVNNFCDIGMYVRPTDPLPVLWHQSLLGFVERYKTSLKNSQVTRLRNLCLKRTHHSITPEIRRELQAVSGVSSSTMMHTSSHNSMDTQDEIRASRETSSMIF